MSQTLLIREVARIVVSIGVGITGCMIGTSAVAEMGAEFDVGAPYGFVGPIAIKDSRLFSMDGGLTWKAGGPLVDTEGRPVLKVAQQLGHLPGIIPGGLQPSQKSP